jgi:hypothetical protein
MAASLRERRVYASASSFSHDQDPERTQHFLVNDRVRKTNSDHEAIIQEARPVCYWNEFIHAD